jgi:hypothetical protein
MIGSGRDAFLFFGGVCSVVSARQIRGDEMASSTHQQKALCFTDFP